MPLFAVEVSDQVMIAHSFRGEVFGPPRRCNGATFVIRAAFMGRYARPQRHRGRYRPRPCAAQAALDRSIPQSRELDAFKDLNTTTEYIAKHVFDHLAKAARAGELGREPREIKAIR